MVKREAQDELSETGSAPDTDQTVVETNRKRAKPSPSKNQNKTPSPSQNAQSSSSPIRPFGPRSAKSKLGEMIIECGIKNLPKQEAQIRTGLTPEQQKELLRQGKGSLRKALMVAIDKL